MPKDTKAIPPPARDSIPSKATRATKLRLDAYTEWLTIIIIGGLIALDKVPWEAGLPVMALLAGATGVLRNRGGGTATGLAMILTKKALVGAGIMALLSGCGGIPPAVQTIGRAVLAEAAGLALDELAKKKGVTIDKSGAVCFESPGLDVNLPQFDGIEFEAISCVAAHVEE